MSIRIQNKLNEMDGVNAKVNLEKKTATVQLGKDISDEELTRAIESMGYHIGFISFKQNK